MGSVYEFQETVWEYFQACGRQLPWREPEPDGSFDAYKILVSEIMLQQTQANRVVPKFQEFLQLFPTIQALASASLAQVLTAWSGLGYNRRAKYLHQTAQILSRVAPWKYEDLLACPGIGTNTAAAILTYAQNQPVVFIETNIRTVFIHHFFTDETAVPDSAIQELVEKTLDREHPREWYWALMDYGTYLKSAVGNRSQASKTYAKQSTFQGSRRQIRGHVIRLLATGKHTQTELAALIPDQRLTTVLNNLLQEGLIILDKNHYRL